jgi:hypothetical protein
MQGKSVQQLSNDVKGLTKIEPVKLRHQVLHAYTKSVSLIWVALTPVLFSAFLAGEIGCLLLRSGVVWITELATLLLRGLYVTVLVIRAYTLQRRILREPKKPSTAHVEADDSAPQASTTSSPGREDPDATKARESTVAAGVENGGNPVLASHDEGEKGHEPSVRDNPEHDRRPSISKDWTWLS